VTTCPRCGCDLPGPDDDCPDPCPCHDGQDPYASIPPSERAELVLVGTLAARGAPEPFAITRALLAALDRNGLTVVTKPARQV
jgi:hypothetical protein